MDKCLEAITRQLHTAQAVLFTVVSTITLESSLEVITRQLHTAQAVLFMAVSTLTSESNIYGQMLGADCKAATYSSSHACGGKYINTRV